MPALEVAIASTSAALGAAVEQVLNAELGAFALRPLGEADLTRPPDVPPPDAVVVAPEDWEELGAWLPQLPKRFPGCPFVLWVEPCLGGMCISLLEDACCGVVNPNWPGPALIRSVRAVVERRPSYPPREWHRFFLDHWEAETGRRPEVTVREFECGCGLGLRLTDREIGGFLFLSEATVGSYLDSLFGKLQIHVRREVGRHSRRALASLTPTIR